ncbi:MAG: hypothetical protein ACO3UY_07980 [Opitutales bacterium]
MNEPTDLASQLDQIFERPSGRALDQMRTVDFQLGIARMPTALCFAPLGTPGSYARR